MYDKINEQQAWELSHPDKNYYFYMLDNNKKSNQKNIKQKKYADLNIEYTSFDPTIIKDLGSLDANYKRLMRS